MNIQHTNPHDHVDVTVGIAIRVEDAVTGVTN